MAATILKNHAWKKSACGETMKIWFIKKQSQKSQHKVSNHSLLQTQVFA